METVTKIILLRSDLGEHEGPWKGRDPSIPSLAPKVSIPLDGKVPSGDIPSYR